MKSLSLNNENKELNLHLQNLQEEKEDLVVWQYRPQKNARAIFVANLVEASPKNNSLSFNTKNDESFDFENGEIFFYAKDKKSLFKADQIAIQNNFLSVKLPAEIKFLDEAQSIDLQKVFAKLTPKHDKSPLPFLENEAKEEYVQSQTIKDRALFDQQLSVRISFDEEDIQFGSLRESKRTRAQEGKTITLGRFNNKSIRTNHPLFDLSCGGFSFLSLSAAEYHLNEFISVLAFDTQRFEKPMQAQIQNIKEADDLGIQYKIGCRFLTDNELIETDT